MVEIKQFKAENQEPWLSAVLPHTTFDLWVSRFHHQQNEINSVWKVTPPSLHRHLTPDPWENDIINNFPG